MYLKSFIYKILLVYLLFLTSMVFVINSFIWMWMFMEMGFIVFLTMLGLSEMDNAMVMVYFLIQVVSTMMIICGILLGFEDLSFVSLWLMQIGFLIKMGFMPFHMWFIMMVVKINWMNSALLMTVQKLSPLCMFSLLMPFDFGELIMLMLMNSFFSALMALKAKNFKLIFAYSSMYHSSWMIMNMYISNLYVIYYLMVYSILVFSLFHFFNYFSLKSKILTLMNVSFYNKLVFFFILFSYCGFPPFSGFMLKWLTTYGLVEVEFDFMIILVLFFNSFLFMFNYLKLFYSSMNLFSSKIKFMHEFEYKDNFLLLFMFLSLFLSCLYFLVLN